MKIHIEDEIKKLFDENGDMYFDEESEEDFNEKIQLLKQYINEDNFDMVNSIITENDCMSFETIHISFKEIPNSKYFKYALLNIK